MKSPGLLVGLLWVALAGCSASATGRGAAASNLPDGGATGATEVVAPPIVQVRSFAGSSEVAVLAWEREEALIGLRTSVSRAGELIGGHRFGDHELYMTPDYARDMGGFRTATAADGQLLLSTGGHRDTHACYYGNECSPMVTTGVRIPDALLRARGDSFVVTFLPGARQPWTISLREELIAAYLARVDSVVGEARR